MKEFEASSISQHSKQGGAEAKQFFPEIFKNTKVYPLACEEKS